MKPTTLTMLLATVLLATTVRTQTAVPGQSESESPLREPRTSESIGTKHALLLCGHPGDAEHRTEFAETIASLHRILVEQYGFPAVNVHVVFGAETTEEDEPVLRSARSEADRDAVLEEIAALRKRVDAADTLWVVVLGHAHFDGRRSWWNLPGPDLNDREFGEAFRDLPAREQLFVVTTAVSGYFIKGLSANGRVVVTATEPDLEINEPFLHLALVEVLRDLPGNEEFDVDADGRLTMFDLYIGLVRNVVARYVDSESIVTEHARLDDNGDGRSTELQIDYLTVEQGGRAEEGTPPPIVAEGTDGWIARRNLLEAKPRADEATDGEESPEEVQESPGDGEESERSTPE